MSLCHSNQNHPVIDSAENESLSSIRTKSRVLVHAYNNQHQIAEGYLLCLQKSMSHDNETSRDFAFAIEAIRKANRLTKRLSEISRGEEVISTAHDFVNRIREYAGYMQVKHVSQGEEAVDFQDFILKGDSDAIFEAIVSLVENSREASAESNDVAIYSDFFTAHEAVKQQDCYLESGAYLKITIVDKGPGMTKQLLAESQGVYCSTKSNEHGVGLGIPLAQSAAERHGGSIVLQSEKGVGTTTILYFSLVD